MARPSSGEKQRLAQRALGSEQAPERVALKEAAQGTLGAHGLAVERIALKFAQRLAIEQNAMNMARVIQLWLEHPAVRQGGFNPVYQTIVTIAQTAALTIPGLADLVGELAFSAVQVSAQVSL